MNWDLIRDLLAGLGGIGLITYLVKLVAEHISKKKIQSYISESAKELERFKKEIENKQKYSNLRFDLYKDLWNSLVNLKFKADELWDEVTEESLKEFANMLKKTKIEVERNNLLLDDKDYISLKDIINRFENYRIGKNKIIDIYKKRDENRSASMAAYFGQAIDNFQIKNQYEDLLNKLSKKFKSNIRLELK